MLRETSVQHGDFLLIFDPATVAFFEKHVHIVSRLTMARGQILSAHDWPFPQRQLLAQSDRLLRQQGSAGYSPWAGKGDPHWILEPAFQES